MRGQKAVVTGSTHGMGLAIVKTLLDGGAEVVLTGRNEKTLEEARTELASRPAHVVRSDAASMADVDALGALSRSEPAFDAEYGEFGASGCASVHDPSWTEP